LGRAGSHHGVEEYLKMKYMLMGGIWIKQADASKVAEPGRALSSKLLGGAKRLARDLSTHSK
jgi:hypothetical protein